MHISISSAAAYLGVSVSTLRRWHLEEYLVPDYLTVGGHRRYSITSLKAFCHSNGEVSQDASETCDEKKTILYSRVSSADQKQDLVRQSERLQEYAKINAFKDYLLIEDCGSGINYKKTDLKKLLKLLLNLQVDGRRAHQNKRKLSKKVGNEDEEKTENKNKKEAA